MKYKYIHFVEGPGPEEDSRIWSCRNNKCGDQLGVVTWYGPWRQYVFVSSPGVVFSADCLADIQKFIETRKSQKDAV